MKGFELNQAVDTDDLNESEAESEVELEVPEGETPAEETEEAEGDEASDEVTVTIGEESPPQEEAERAPEWVRELRKSNREKDRELRELREKLKTTTQPAAVELGKKPTLEDCDYDTDRFERDLTAFHERKRAKDEEERKKQEDGAKAQAAWQAKVNNYGKLKGELKVSDFEDAEQAIQDVLSPGQIELILRGMKNPAIVTYALGKNLKKAKELASIADPVEFVVAVRDLEQEMKVTPRKSAPIPESTVRGNARVSAGIDSQLERLRADADRTGDRTKVAAYMRQQANRKK